MKQVGVVMRYTCQRGERCVSSPAFAEDIEGETEAECNQAARALGWGMDVVKGTETCPECMEWLAKQPKNEVRTVGFVRGSNLA